MARPPAQSSERQTLSDTKAIERVLKAERDGVEALRQSADEARKLVEDARTQAGDIARRADALISKLHAAYLQKVQLDLQRLAETSHSSNDTADNDHAPAALAEAVRRAAVKLTGGP